MSVRVWAAVAAVLGLIGPAMGTATAVEKNEVLMGVVPVEDGRWVRCATVLPGSPAEKAGLEDGDVLLGIGTRRVESVEDVHDGLAELNPGQSVPVVFGRKKKKHRVKVEVVDRDGYDWSKIVRGRGQTGFEAPPWHVYAWANVPRGAAPPTAESTEGKVIVIHCFQSW